MNYQERIEELSGILQRFLAIKQVRMVELRRKDVPTLQVFTLFILPTVRTVLYWIYPVGLSFEGLIVFKKRVVKWTTYVLLYYLGKIVC